MNWSPEQISLLGTDTDRAIATKIGRSLGAVETKRADLGIPAHRQHRFDWTPARLRLLGRMSDAALAGQLGCDYKTVFRERRRRGIAAFAPQHAPG